MQLSPVQNASPLYLERWLRCNAQRAALSKSAVFMLRCKRLYGSNLAALESWHLFVAGGATQACAWPPTSRIQRVLKAQSVYTCRLRLRTEPCVAMAMTASLPRCGRGPRLLAPHGPSVQNFLPRYKGHDIVRLSLISYGGRAGVFAQASSKRQPCAQWVTEEQWRVRAWPATASERP